MQAQRDVLADSEYVDLLERHQPALRRFVGQRVHGGAIDQYDIVQETNIALWKKRSRYTPDASFASWAFRFAHFKILHHRRRLARSSRFTPIETVADPPDPKGQNANLPDDRLAALRHCLEKLSSRQRALIEARYGHGGSVESFAKTDGKSAETLRVELLRLRRTLRRQVEARCARRA